MAKSKIKSREKMIKAVGAPLGYFVLALLIVETFLGAALVGGNLDATLQLICIIAGIAMFFTLTFAVCLFVWFKPLNLIFDRDAHLKKGISSLTLSHTLTESVTLRLEAGNATPEQVKELYDSYLSLQNAIGEPGIKLLGEHSKLSKTQEVKE